MVDKAGGVIGGASGQGQELSQGCDGIGHLDTVQIFCGQRVCSKLAVLREIENFFLTTIGRSIASEPFEE